MASDTHSVAAGLFFRRSVALLALHETDHGKLTVCARQVFGLVVGPLRHAVQDNQGVSMRDKTESNGCLWSQVARHELERCRHE